MAVDKFCIRIYVLKSACNFDKHFSLQLIIANIRV